ncbi:DNA-dependent metalloprotease dvc-1 isoform X2 [Phymastichus coffea]|uniref:DNA-dependent metalloprotease dvc-1 isoform X2 n=1 Tax=Phymastichus coffea TaxID=108790 RepID=UPI00273B9A52|nr:DNA-dependent metalloprotease dvc-1 isoform X2 [Phymastichus coffea]
MSYAKFDEKVAQMLQNQLNYTGITENAFFSKEKEKENYRPRTLIDETLEYIDPTPNIHTLFVQFNEKFFWNVLLPVQVKWSPRMTSCAGICSFHPRNKECVIALSSPLLKLRPRKDLVETLLHEMIHAYLFLTNDNRDRDGHGPVFQSHMHRINKAAGTKITIYHTFYEEVKLYQQHWWRCNGPCQKRAPYFGMVRRAMNRAPGPNDFWWSDHIANCGGKFIKIKEPEKPEKKKKKSNLHDGSAQNRNSLSDYQQISNQNTNKNSAIKSQASNRKSNVYNTSTSLKKLGNSTNNVHGWGTGGPKSNYKSSTNADSKILPESTQPSLFFSGTLGGSGSGRSNLIDKYSNPSNSNLVQSTSNKTLFYKNSSVISSIDNHEKLETVQCPNCQNNIEETMINKHLDDCLEHTNEQKHVAATSIKKRKHKDDYLTGNKIFKPDNITDSNSIECPLCSKKIKIDTFNQHLDMCANNDYTDLTENQVIALHDTSSSSVNLQDSPHVCLICEKILEPNVTLNEHLEDCVSSIFNDSNNDDVIEELKTDKTEHTTKYPCPVCMSLIDEITMNIHLDSCLNQRLYQIF